MSFKKGQGIEASNFAVPCRAAVGIPRLGTASWLPVQVIGDPEDEGWVNGFHTGKILRVFRNAEGKRRYEVEYDEVTPCDGLAELNPMCCYGCCDCVCTGCLGSCLGSQPARHYWVCRKHGSSRGASG